MTVANSAAFLVNGVDIALWSGLEINLAICCASVPQLKAMFVKIIPKLNNSYDGSSQYPYGTGLSLSGRGGTTTIGGTRVTRPDRSFNGDGDGDSDDDDDDGVDDTVATKPISTDLRDQKEEGGGGGGTGASGGIGGILVQRAFEMQSMPMPDNGSEQNLMVSSWNVDCYSKGEGQTSTPIGDRSSPV